MPKSRKTTSGARSRSSTAPVTRSARSGGAGTSHPSSSGTGSGTLTSTTSSHTGTISNPGAAAQTSALMSTPVSSPDPLPASMDQLLAIIRAELQRPGPGIPASMAGAVITSSTLPTGTGQV